MSNNTMEWDMSEWIEYLNDRSVESPTEGFVEYEDTWDDSKSYLMDVAKGSDDLIWSSTKVYETF